MKDNCFVDTNILVYAHTNLEAHKQALAQKLLRNENLIVSTHILLELSNVLSKRILKDWKLTNSIIEETCKYYTVHPVSLSTLQSAFRLAPKYKYSFYDSLVIASAIESGCSILYSEDMQHHQKIETDLLIVNPFMLSA